MNNTQAQPQQLTLDWHSDLDTVSAFIVSHTRAKMTLDKRGNRATFRKGRATITVMQRHDVKASGTFFDWVSYLDSAYFPRRSSLEPGQPERCVKESVEWLNTWAELLDPPVYEDGRYGDIPAPTPRSGGSDELIYGRDPSDFDAWGNPI